MLEAWIIDDSRADRGILSLLLNDIEEISGIREFLSGSSVLKFLDSNTGNFNETKFLVLCDANLGVELGEIVLTQISLKIEKQNRYHVLMSGMLWNEDDWKEHDSIDDFMEKKGDLDIWRSDLNEIVDSARKKLL